MGAFRARNRLQGPAGPGLRLWSAARRLRSTGLALGPTSSMPGPASESRGLGPSLTATMTWMTRPDSRGPGPSPSHWQPVLLQWPRRRRRQAGQGQPITWLYGLGGRLGLQHVGNFIVNIGAGPGPAASSWRAQARACRTRARSSG